jgi:tripartite-type tricarboxylate transporter receptor subunit TctC
MCISKRSFLVTILFSLIALMVIGLAGPVYSQGKYPARPIDLIVPFAPGGGSDLNARILADFLEKKWNVPINVINKPGGSSVPANLEVYEANPDGYTLLADSQSSCPFLGLAIKDLPFEVMDRTFISMLAATPSVFGTSSKNPWNNLNDLEAVIKKAPEEFTWGSLGAGAGDYCIRQYLDAIDVPVSKTKPIVCRGGAEVTALVAGGHIKLGLSSTMSALPHVQAGTMKALALSGFTMEHLYPGVTSTAEQGYPTVDQVWWFGITGPPNLPSDIVSKWEEACQEIFKNPEYASRVKKLGAVPRYKNARESREHVRKEVEVAKKLWLMK